MSSRSKLDDVLSGAGASRYADIESIGIATVMERLGEAAPAVIQMQAALVGGIVMTQRREAERLAKDDEGSAEAMAAAARAEKFAQLHQEVVGVGSALMKFATGQQQAGVFHGFVFAAEGVPAEGYKVEVTGLSSKALKAATDDTGYFRIAFRGPENANAAKRAREAAAAAAPFTDAAAVGADAEKEPQTSVTVSNPSGRALFSDPAPPSLEEGASIFRYYALPPEGSKGRSSGKSRA
jgi:hypothetical protein